MTFNLVSVYKSLIREIQTIITDVKAAGITANFEYYAWDSRGAVTELPEVDLIGLVDWTYSENNGLAVVEAGLLLSTVYDINLFKEVEILDHIRNHCVDGEHYKQWKLYDDNGDEYGLLSVTDFEVLPSGRSEVRSTRHIGIELVKASNMN